MKYILLLSLFISLDIYAAFGMRKCALLPIKDNTPEGSLAYQIYNKVEYYLKDSEWCYYRSNSEILNLLENHRRSIQQYLNNPNVLKIVAKKLKVGSLIKIKIDNYLGGVKIFLTVLGENGKDIYYQNKTKLSRIDVDLIADHIKNWLSIYEKNIPYNARVTGVLGTQFTIDGGTAFGFRKNFKIVIIRPTKKKKHPLLKEIINWETIKIGTAQLYNSTDSTSQGRILQYDTRRKIKRGDWVILLDKENSYVKETIFSPKKGFEFGKLGMASIYLQTSSFDTLFNSSSTKKLNGFKFGVDLRAELWLTRMYFAGINFSKSFATMKSSLGTFSQASQNVSNSGFQIFGGYKYLPLGFFYGPQINAYFGYSNYSYGFETQSSDLLTSFSFNGLLLGVNGEVPFMKRFRGKLGLELIFSPSFSQETNVVSSINSSRSTKFFIEGIYKYKVNLDLNIKYENIINRTLLSGPTTSIEFKDSIFNFGASFTF